MGTWELWWLYSQNQCLDLTGRLFHEDHSKPHLGVGTLPHSTGIGLGSRAFFISVSEGQSLLF